MLVVLVLVVVDVVSKVVVVVVVVVVVDVLVTVAAHRNMQLNSNPKKQCTCALCCLARLILQVFPDEIDAPLDMLAKVRFQKYVTTSPPRYRAMGETFNVVCLRSGTATPGRARSRP